MSVRGQSGEMVQPNEGPGIDYAPGPGDSSLGMAETLPPELATHEFFQHLLAENQDLKIALEQSNLMLRKRHIEMLALQDAQRNEHQFIASKFTAARDLVQNLTKERNALQVQLQRAQRRLEETVHRPEMRQPVDLSVTDQMHLKTTNKEVDPSDHEIRTESESLLRAGDRSSDVQQDFERKLQETENQKALLMQEITKLQGQINELRQEMTEKATEAQKQLQLLTEEKASVKAQVTSLLGELKESQLSLESSLQERKKLEESLRNAREQQKEWEMQVKQHVVQLDQRRLQAQSLDTALKKERQNACEEMRKLAQLQAAYHQLFQEYDAHIKKTLQMEKHAKELSSQVADLQQQLQEAEEALVAKQEVIDKLKEEAEGTRAQLDNIPVLKAQVDIYREDFLAERAAREKLAAERDKLLEQIEKLQQERAMINRHSDNLLHSQTGSGLAPFHNPLPSGFAPMSELQPHFCPKCLYKAPDMDTLQIHVMDCIQ